MTHPLERLREALGDRYAIERELGAGGMATVYLASDLNNRRKVAIKVLKAGVTGGRDRFEREAAIVANLTHPHILPLHDSGRVGDLCWFVSPWVEGESLSDRLDREGALPLNEALRIAIEVADALAYAHDRGLVHRDIKPRNIMMEAGHAVIADFGIALQLDAAPADRLTTPGVSPGTPHYMSPEQLAGERRIDGRSDIYSLGCVLYEMIAGDPPFVGSTVDVIRARKLAGILPDLQIVRPAVSDQLEQVTLRCLAIAPADRFRNAVELIDALSNANDELVRASASTGDAPTARKQQAFGVRARRWFGWGIVGVAVAAAFATLVGFLSTRAFDVKLQVPAAYAPSRSDFTTVGWQALFSFAVFGFAAIAAWILVRQLARLINVLARKVMPGLTSRVRSAGSTITPRWHSFWRSARPTTAAEAFLATAIVVSTAIIIRYGSLLATLFTGETDILSCANRPLHRSFTLSMTVLVTALGFGWFGVFGWLDRRNGNVEGIAVPKWGSAILIALLLLLMSLPWRLLWDPATERVLVNGQRAYLLVETPSEMVLYMPERGTAEVHAKDGPAGIVRRHMNGYVFEERSVFDSNQARCLSVTQGRPGRSP